MNPGAVPVWHWSRAAVVLCAAILALIGDARAASLDALQSSWPELNLRATLGSGASPEVEQGSNLQLRIAADDEASVAVVLVNSAGKAQVSIPRRDGSLDRVVRGTEMLYPDLLAGETLYADMPVGKGSVYVVASDQAIFPATAPGNRAEWQSAEAVESRIRSAIAAQSKTRLAIRRLPVYVVAPQMKEFVSTDEFVQFFGIGTRSVPDANRGFAIEFKHNSADLTEWSRRQLDAVGKGMQDSSLARDAFMIEGHTDDVGTDEYNMDLSRKRATSVTQYLAGKGVQKTRLRENAMGESMPAMEGETDEARAKNRRVVIRRLDSNPSR